MFSGWVEGTSANRGRRGGERERVREKKIPVAVVGIRILYYRALEAPGQVYR